MAVAPARVTCGDNMGGGAKSSEGRLLQQRQEILLYVPEYRIGKGDYTLPERVSMTLNDLYDLSR